MCFIFTHSQVVLLYEYYVYIMLFTALGVITVFLIIYKYILNDSKTIPYDCILLIAPSLIADEY